MKRILRLFPLLGLLLLQSCAPAVSTVGLRIVEPRSGLSGVGSLISPLKISFITVDSLQPTLKWEPSSDPDVSYDLVVYKAYERETEARDQRERWQRGERAYYREGITGASHRVEDALMPGCKYMWSVRTRRGSVTSEWSSFCFVQKSDVFNVNRSQTGFLYMFETPQVGK